MQYRKVDNCDRLLEGDPRLIQSQLIEYIIYLKEERKEEKVKKAETQAMFVLYRMIFQSQENNLRE